MRRILSSLLITPLLVVPTLVSAQATNRVARSGVRCDEGWNNDRGHFCEVREYTISPSTRVSVDGGDNGGVSFHGSDRRDIKVVARVQASADDDATAGAIAREIRVLTDGGRIRSEGPATHGNAGWSVSYDVYLPTQSNLEATTENGGISADDVKGQMNFHATNGGIHLSDVGGDVRARTTNGGVTADLSGTTWQGQGLDLQTTNGSATVYVPRGYNASLETGTTNGGMRVDFPVTVQGSLNRHISTQLGSGGPTVRVVTTNGGVHIAQR